MVLPLYVNTLGTSEIAVYRDRLAIDHSTIPTRDIVSCSSVDTLLLRFVRIKTTWSNTLRLQVHDPARLCRLVSALLTTQVDLQSFPLFSYNDLFHIYQDRIEASRETLLAQVLATKIAFDDVIHVSLDDYKAPNQQPIGRDLFTSRSISLHFKNGSQHSVDFGNYTDDVYRLMMSLLLNKHAQN
jgi:hypothetical protein